MPLFNEGLLPAAEGFSPELFHHNLGIQAGELGTEAAGLGLLSDLTGLAGLYFGMKIMSGKFWNKKRK
ncbi:MAG TPA: hypothetical protein VI937_00650 [Negativicutes bacterium]|nr:hypothetical protein [Negativicutes bacterium]